MTVVVADTSPLNYLVQIDEGDLFVGAMEALSNFALVLDKLTHTNFRADRSLIGELIVEDEERRRYSQG